MPFLEASSPASARPLLARGVFSLFGVALPMASSPPFGSGDAGAKASPGRSSASSWGISRSSSCKRSSRSWTSLGGAGTMGPSMPPRVCSSVSMMSSSSLASDSWSRYTPVWWTVQELIRNSFLFLSSWSRGMRKSGTRRCVAWRDSGAPWSSMMLRPSLIKWSMVSSSSVSGMGAHKPLCTTFPPFFPSFLSRASKSRA
mmetsp:Transcript_82032/g.214017  ORF Transcript_82032/g.214017 Transcript_82032/m.214017 type:complete len:200 (-) Transcript_82032:311-910(-)